MRIIISAAALVVSLVTHPLIAESQRVLKYSDTAIPKSLIVQKGTVLEFNGSLRDEGLPTTFILKNGTRERASGKFEKQWVLQWDSSREASGSHFLTLERIDPNGAVTRLARISVQLVEGPLFKITSPAPEASSDGLIAVHVTPAGGQRIAGGEILINRNSRGVQIDSTGKGSVNLAGLKPGPHEISVRVKLDGGIDYETEPVRVVLTPKVTIQRTDVGPLDLRNATPHMNLKVIYPEGMSVKSAEVSMNGKMLMKQDSPPFDQVTVNPEGLSTGRYLFSVEITCSDGARHMSPDIEVNVIGNAVNEFKIWRAKLQEMLGQNEQSRQEFVQVDAAWRSGQADIGQYAIAIRKLLAADLYVASNVQDVEPPASLSQAHRSELNAVTGGLWSAFRQLVTIERGARNFVESYKGTPNSTELERYLKDSFGGNYNRALLMKATSEERLFRVAQTLEGLLMGPTGVVSTSPREQTISYPIRNQANPDFIAWRQKVLNLMETGESVYRNFEGAGTGVDKDLTLRKLIANDGWLAMNLPKMQISKAISEAHEREMGAILARLAAAYSNRTRAARIVLKEVEANLNAGRTSGLPSLRVGTNAGNYMKEFSVNRANALERLSVLSARYGIR